MGIYYFTPFAPDGNLGAAYNQYMELLPNNDDWACFIDGDAMFLTPDWGNLIAETVGLYPDASMFTCYTNRVNNQEQLYRGRFSETRDIVHHRNVAKVCRETGRKKVTELTRMISGVMMIIKKSTWRQFPFSDGLLGVDNQISKQLLTAGLKVYLIRSIYLLHYYRMAEGRTYKEHLKITGNE